MLILQDKILQSTGRGHSVTVTNDGATILKSLHIDNPAAKVLVGILIVRFRVLILFSAYMLVLEVSVTILKSSKLPVNNFVGVITDI